MSNRARCVRQQQYKMLSGFGNSLPHISELCAELVLLLFVMGKISWIQTYVWFLSLVHFFCNYCNDHHTTWCTYRPAVSILFSVLYFRLFSDCEVLKLTLLLIVLQTALSIFFQEAALPAYSQAAATHFGQVND